MLCKWQALDLMKQAKPESPKPENAEKKFCQMRRVYKKQPN
jgi:hypothetical protein